jgi:putative oxidoreductase
VNRTFLISPINALCRQRSAAENSRWSCGSSQTRPEHHLIESNRSEQMIMKLPRIQTGHGLLVLRGSAALLRIVYGWKKFIWLFPLISGRVAWSSWGFAAQIGKMGFPLPILLGVFVVLCEFVGALFIALGLLTRVSAALTALSMAGPLYFSVRVGEASWHLAALYALSFIALAVRGPGKFSIDQLLKWRKRSEA